MVNFGDLDTLVDASSVTAWDLVWAVIVILLGFLIAKLLNR